MYLEASKSSHVPDDWMEALTVPRCNDKGSNNASAKVVSNLGK